MNFDLEYLNLPSDTIAECLFKSKCADAKGDYQVAHQEDKKALVLFVNLVKEQISPETHVDIASHIVNHLTSNSNNPRWYAWWQS